MFGWEEIDLPGIGCNTGAGCRKRAPASAYQVPGKVEELDYIARLYRKRMHTRVHCLMLRQSQGGRPDRRPFYSAVEILRYPRFNNFPNTECVGGERGYAGCVCIRRPVDESRSRDCAINRKPANVPCIRGYCGSNGCVTAGSSVYVSSTKSSVILCYQLIARTGTAYIQRNNSILRRV